MSYQISISRGYRWSSDGSYTPISIEEWNQVVDSLQLERVDHQQSTNPRTGEVMRIECPDSAKVSDGGPLLSWRKGVIDTYGPPEVIDQCRNVADALSAGIFGEEGENY